jgi:hypothetical protein
MILQQGQEELRMRHPLNELPLWNNEVEVILNVDKLQLKIRCSQAICFPEWEI